MEKAQKIIVIYRSKYGSAKRYAEWISEEVQADLIDSKKVSLSQLLQYDMIVFGGALYVSGIIGFSLIRNNYNRLKDKKIIVFSVGAAPSRQDTVNDVLDHNFSREMREHISYYHLRGSFDFSKLNFIDKVLMTLLRIKLKLKKQEELDGDGKGMLACYNYPVDWTSKKAIIPILQCIKDWKMIRSCLS